MYIAKTIYNDYIMSDEATRPELTIYRATAKRFYTKKELYNYAYKIFKLHKNEIIPEKIIDDENDERFTQAIKEVDEVLNKHYNSILDFNDYMGYIESNIDFELKSDLENIKNYELVIRDIEIKTSLQVMYITYTDEALSTI